MTQRHGARINLPFDGHGVAYAAQTIESGLARNAPYVTDRREDGRNRERFVDYDDNALSRRPSEMP